MIIIMPIVFTSINAWNDYESAYELSEKSPEDERESKEKKGDEEKLLSHHSYNVVFSQKISPGFYNTSELHHSIKMDVLTPPPKLG